MRHSCNFLLTCLITRVTYVIHIISISCSLLFFTPSVVFHTKLFKQLLIFSIYRSSICSLCPEFYIICKLHFSLKFPVCFSFIYWCICFRIKPIFVVIYLCYSFHRLIITTKKLKLYVCVIGLVEHSS